MTTDTPPLIVIVGETASGKSALGIEVARQCNGEIIAADSRTIYRGMDIGTAKPSMAERAAVPHHLVDISTPDKPVSAADFKRMALNTIADITDRGHLPVMVGGSGLYVDAVLFDYAFTEKADISRRAELEQLAVEELQRQLHERGIALPNNERNPRHLIRQLETGGVSQGRSGLRPHTLVIGVRRDPEELRSRIVERVDAMIASGLEQEVRSLVARYGRECPVLQTIGYQEFFPYLAGEQDIAQVREAIIRATIAYAKRQRTWFKRNPYIKYPCDWAETEELITTLLNN